MTTTIVFGPAHIVHAFVEGTGAVERTTKYSDGQVVTSPLVHFEGGYDDWSGSFGWAEAHGDIVGKRVNFSPRPGVWMIGVRVTLAMKQAQDGMV